MPANSAAIDATRQKGFWTKLRDGSIWPASLFLNATLAIMWISNIFSLLERGGFTGIAGWTTPGICIVGVRCWLLYRRMVLEWKEFGRAQRRRLLWAQFVPTLLNFLTNLFVIGLVYRNLYIGSLKWSHWDSWCLAVAGLSILTMLYFRRLSMKLRIAGLALGTRAFQQAVLVVSPQLIFMPWGTPVGLIGTAALLWGMSIVEYMAAREERTTSLREAWLLVWAETSNLTSASILMAGWTSVTLFS